MAQVKIGPEFFSKAKNDYSEWKWALVREFGQNSIDCGSKNIAFNISLNEDGNTVVEVINDGSPMDETTITDKLLSLGSSGKNFQGSVGGFGKAKELLYFCWIGYRIESGNHVVVGSGAEYTIKKQRKAFKGTKSTIVIEGDYRGAIIYQARLFIEVSNVTPKFTVNDDPVKGRFACGYYRRPLNCGEVYTNRKLDNSVVVRIDGTPMFTMWTKYPKCVVIELTGESAETLTSNRDGLRYEARNELEAFVGDLTTNKRKALSAPAIEYIRFDGDKIDCRGLANQAVKNGATTLAKTIEQEYSGHDDDGLATVSPLTNGSYGEDNITEVDAGKANALMTKFTIKNETGRKLPAKWRPDDEKFCRYAYRMAMIWSRLLTVIHRIYGIDDEFTIGFIFSDDVVAQHEYSNEHGRTYFLNPVEIAEGKWTNRWQHSINSGRDSLNLLSAVALHEVVHGLGYSDHDEEFSTKLTFMISGLINNTRELVWAYRNKDK